VVVLLAVACATTDSEVRRLQARSTYEQGLRHLAEQRGSMALSAFKEAVQLDPRNVVFRNALGVTLLHVLGKPDEAQAEFRRAIELDPSYAEAHHNLGLALAEEGRHEEAVAQYRKALSLPIYPTPEVGYYNLGNAYFYLNKPREAEEAFRAALRLSPKMIQAYWGLGRVLSLAGRLEEAKAAFRTARDLDPASPFGRAAVEALKSLGEGG
jgi:tetratricopeptide (TPR) repeat protein